MLNISCMSFSRWAPFRGFACTKPVEIVHQVVLDVVEPGLDLRHAFALHAKGDELGLGQTIIALGELLAQHLGTPPPSNADLSTPPPQTQKKKNKNPSPPLFFLLTRSYHWHAPSATAAFHPAPDDTLHTPAFFFSFSSSYSA